jgi:membrane protein implicated in regulation of membrane protease activity
MTLPIIGEVVFWHWWALGLLFLVIEMTAPGFFFLFTGVAAAVVGAILLATPGLEWQYQLLLFAVISVASITGWRIYVKKNPHETDEPTLNQRGAQYVGRVFVLEEDMSLGRGKISVDDTTWRAEYDQGGDLPTGSRVKVVGIDGTTLKVEPA